MTQERIINLLKTAIELAGDGGPRPFTDEEETAMYNFLGQIEASAIDFTDAEYDPVQKRLHNIVTEKDVRDIARFEAQSVVWDHEQIIELIDAINKLGHQLRELERKVEETCGVPKRQ